MGANVHLTTILTLDIKLATLLQTLASAPDCPKVGSIDFGERLTIVLEEVSLLDLVAGYAVRISGHPLPEPSNWQCRKVRQQGQRGA